MQREYAFIEKLDPDDVAYMIEKKRVAAVTSI
jgi:hypothetical protein